MSNKEDFNVEKEIQDIKKILTEQKQEKLFGKYHDLFLLVLGFVFTTIAGGAISYLYQVKLNEYNKEQIDYENKKESEKDVFKNLSEIVTERQLIASRLMHRINMKDNESK